MYKYYFRRCETDFHKWCQRIYYCKELISDYYHFSDDMKEHYKEKYKLSSIIVNDYKKLYESLNETQKEILSKYYLNGKTIPWSTSMEDTKTIYNKWEEIVFPNGISRIKTVDTMSVAKTIKELRKNAGYNREEVAGLLNISVATLRKYEDGKSLVRLDILVSMLQIYGCDINEFSNRSNDNYVYYKNIGVKMMHYFFKNATIYMQKRGVKMNKLMKISFSLILMFCCLVMLPGCKKDEEYSNELKFKELKIYKEDGSIANSCTALGSWCEAGNRVTFEYHQGEKKLTRSDSEPWNGLFADTFYIIGFTQDMEDDTLDDTVWSGGLYQKFVNEDSDLKYKRVGLAHFGSDSKGNRITVTFVSEGPDGRYEYTYTNY